MQPPLSENNTDDDFEVLETPTSPLTSPKPAPAAEHTLKERLKLLLQAQSIKAEADEASHHEARFSSQLRRTVAEHPIRDSDGHKVVQAAKKLARDHANASMDMYLRMHGCEGMCQNILGTIYDEFRSWITLDPDTSIPVEFSKLSQEKRKEFAKKLEDSGLMGL